MNHSPLCPPSNTNMLRSALTHTPKAPVCCSLQQAHNLRCNLPAAVPPLTQLASPPPKKTPTSPHPAVLRADNPIDTTLPLTIPQECAGLLDVCNIVGVTQATVGAELLRGVGAALLDWLGCVQHG